ncbi:1,4-dihydroxy-2-naphthoate octaprenyltransferase [Erwinia toletana]|uniref:1,4-dihydroxy-2-naphthoate octaprenyltransferase n=1 Tax=Winslowiella toletana TaxID=92490 RepID=A0ABS4PB32_9GAMM|nr:1,4-dihydroxy-2-naphthoate polyprenyltransferase [Winslowiella toletana]MBP2169153.1 1,4-dihydroxy-2-naphthoate octaprenyltransferase [Winslowiella toletana]
MENIQLAPRLTASRAWLESLRLRTLPLAFASIINGSALAYWQGHFTPGIALLTLLTTALLQILSNLANDYGDAQKGSDTPQRIGPLRGMQKGAISPLQMRSALVLTAVITIFSGIALVVLACTTLSDMLGFIALGGLAMAAAIAYTVGKKPYGYLGLGDLSVLIFFGWLGVNGSQYLQTHNLNLIDLLPATACGLLAAAVLNVNNLRDIDSDRQNGKFTLAVRLGPVNARCYHAGLLSCALLCFAFFALFASQTAGSWLFLLAAPLIYQQTRYILRETSPLAMRPMLEKTVKMALLVNVLFALGLILS